MNRRELARCIDHTLLRPEATDEEVARRAEEAVRFGCAALCVNLARLPAAVRRLEGSDVAPCCVVSFPLGASGTVARVAETEEARRRGAAEIDTVIDLGLVKAGRWEEVTADLAALVEAGGPARLKVILETCLLEEGEKEKAMAAVCRSGAAFAKTSTGFAAAGAREEDVRLMARLAAGRVGIKAAGGIGNLALARAMLEAGADRLGMSRTAAVLTELE